MTAAKAEASLNVGFVLRGESSRQAAAGDIVTVMPAGDDRMFVKVGKKSADTTKPARGMTMALDRAGVIALGRYLISAGQRMTAMDKPLQQAEARVLACNVIAGQDVFSTISVQETAAGDFLFSAVGRHRGLPGGGRAGRRHLPDPPAGALVAPQPAAHRLLSGLSRRLRQLPYRRLRRQPGRTARQARRR